MRPCSFKGCDRAMASRIVARFSDGSASATNVCSEHLDECILEAIRFNAVEILEGFMTCPYCEKPIEKAQERVEVSMPHRAKFIAHKVCGERLATSYGGGDRVKLRPIDEDKPKG